MKLCDFVAFSQNDIDNIIMIIPVETSATCALTHSAGTSDLIDFYTAILIVLSIGDPCM